MTLTDRIDACITEMQAICNSSGDQDTVEEIAVATADELAACRDVARGLLEQLGRLERIARDTIDADGTLLMACDNAIAAVALAKGDAP